LAQEKETAQRVTTSINARTAAKAKGKSHEPAEGTRARSVGAGKGQTTNANTAKNSRNGRRVRGPDKEKHQARVEFEDTLKAELAAVCQRLADSASTLDELKKRFPDFKLWTVLSPAEQAELLEEDFKPKAYARNLTARKFAVDKETIKKSRQIVKRLRDKPNA
jgi:hypothetical protein